MDGSPKASLKLTTIGTVLTFALLFSACATTKHSATNGGAVGNIISETEVQESPAATTQNPTEKTNISAPYVMNEPVLGVELKNKLFDYPVANNPSVEKWLHYFTGKGRKFFAKYLERGYYFIPEIARVLKQSNMPQDLVYLAMIESGFNNSARSHAKAVGPWQFIKGTGQRYGLNINYWLDERRDTRKATMAAIAYLRELYQEFGSWELSAAAYNAGENKVRRAIAKYKTHDFWEIAKKRFLKRETRDYVPKIIAAAIISKNPELFAFEDPFKNGNKPTSNPTTLLLADKEEVVNLEEPTPKELEEVIAKDDTIEDPSDPTLSKEKETPAADEEVATNDSADTSDDEDYEDDHAIVSRTPLPTLTPSVYMVANPNERIIEFEVKGPVDLLNISKAAGIPYSSLKMLNPELLRWITPPYMKSYKIKLPLSSKERFLTTYNDENFDRRVVFQEYTVKRGDNLNKIAHNFKVEIDPIRELNNLSRRATSVSAGTKILLPVPTGYKRVIASMYDEKPQYGSKKRHRRQRTRKRASIGKRSSAVYYKKIEAASNVSGVIKKSKRKPSSKRH